MSHLLQCELKHRFRQYTDPCDPDIEPLFLMSTMLDPRYKVLRQNQLRLIVTILTLLHQLHHQMKVNLPLRNDSITCPGCSKRSQKKEVRKLTNHLSIWNWNIQSQFAEEADVMQFWQRSILFCHQWPWTYWHPRMSIREVNKWKTQPFSRRKPSNRFCSVKTNYICRGKMD